MRKIKSTISLIITSTILSIALAASFAADADPLAKAGESGNRAERVTAAPQQFKPNGFSLPKTLWYFRGASSEDLQKVSGAPAATLPTYHISLAKQISTPVKNQGASGLCWAFADIAQLESRILKKAGQTIANGTPPNFSEQDLADFYLNFSDGGNSFMAASYFGLHGAVRESDEPWRGYIGRWDLNNPRSKYISKWHYIGSYTGNIKTGDPAVIKRLILSGGPVSTAMSVKAATDWQEWWNGRWPVGGVVVPETVGIESPADLDHAVTIIGWDDRMLQLDPLGEETTSTAVGAWLVKNTWGSAWGDGGYCWIGYGAAGIGSALSYYPHDGIREYSGKSFSLSTDRGSGGDAALLGSYMVTKYIVPSIPAGVDPKLYAVDVIAPEVGMAYEVRIYRNFDGNRPVGPLLGSKQGSFSNAGYYSIPLSNPVAVKKGDTLAIWMRLEDDAKTGIVPLANPRVMMDPFGVSADGSYRDIVYRNERIFAVGNKILLMDVPDSMHPKSDAGGLNLSYTQNGSPVTFTKCMAFGSRYLVAVKGTPSAAPKDYSTANTAINLQANAAATTVSMPFILLDIYNPFSPREVPLTAPLPSNWAKHPNLAASYDDRKRTILNDPVLAADGNTLYVIANRYQDRYDAGARSWRFWWDLGMMGWRLDDPYNPTPIADRTFERTSLYSGSVSKHTYWYHDYDGSSKLFKKPSGSFYGLNYIYSHSTTGHQKTSLIDKDPVSFMWDKDRNGTKETRVVASIVNSVDKSPTDRSKAFYPGDPGDILFTNVSGSSPALISRLRAGGIDDPEDLPAPEIPIPQPAEDMALVDNYLFVALGEACVAVVDVKDPRNPKVVDKFFWGAGRAISIAAWRDSDGSYYVFVVNDKDFAETGNLSPIMFLRYTFQQSFQDLSRIENYVSWSGAYGTWRDVYTDFRKALPIRARIGSAN